MAGASTLWGKTRYFVMIIIFLIQITTWSTFSLFAYYTICDNGSKPESEIEYTFERISWINITACGSMLIGLLGAHLVEERWGVKNIYASLTALGVVAGLIFGLFAKKGFPAYVVLHVFLGLSMSNTLTMIFGFVNSWAPMNELTFFMGLTMATYDLPYIFAGQYYGLVCKPLGSANMYYGLAACNGILLVFFWIFYTESPSHNRFVSPEELRYIHENQLTINNKTIPKVPYAAFFTDHHILLAVLIGTPVFASFFVSIITAPVFVMQIFSMSELKAGYVMTLGFAVAAVLKISLPFVNHKIPGNDTIKFYVYGTAALFTTTAYFVIMGNLTKDREWMLYVAQISYGIGMALSVPSFNVAIQVMIQQYANFLGTMITVGYLSTGVIYSLITQYFVTLKQEWSFRVVFFIAAVFNFHALLVQLLIYKMEPRPFTRTNKVADKADSIKKVTENMESYPEL